MHPLRLIPSLLLAAGLTTGLTSCSQKERTDVSNTAREMYSDSKASLANAWENVRNFTFEKRDDFRARAQAMSASMDAKISEVRANYSEAKASASRKAAMNELKNSEADYKAKLDALGQATAATWDSAKQNVIAAWERLEASYKKARAD
jgi:hypothetical protein